MKAQSKRTQSVLNVPERRPDSVLTRQHLEFAFVSLNRLQIPSGNEGITELQMLLKDM